ncbi:hypothetical protein BGW38_004018 [Lunasporangiospora selenospora]|uniref:GST N-terminal domain-containing protein n=1 Tax=Lunasporangiospora selenospora TaxID=979761 RepID=A0A9P6FR32_9FUNG|nr:hypothetical protein BGW38_004018 [Lunasporangiospora selenospora]
MSPIQTTHFSKDAASASEVMAHPESFKLKYFQIFGLGQTCRDMLSYAGAKWEDTYPGDWNAEKALTPFGCLPLLFIRKGDKEIVISESIPVESYLARQFGLLGDNEYEETLIKAFHSSSFTLMGAFGSFVTWNQPEARDKCYEMFKQNMLANWIASHEKHLVDNGSNGHYIRDKASPGSRLSLADIKTTNLIEHFIGQPEGKEIVGIIRESPALWKLYETVINHPKLASWRSSDAFKTLEENTTQFYKDPMAAISKF